MLGICFNFDSHVIRREWWDWHVDWFGVDQAWERNRPEGFERHSKFLPQQIKTAGELPSDIPLIVLTAPDARFVKGDECLYDFVHPEDAIYWFGHDHTNMDPEDFADREPDHKVFIPIEKYEVYSAFVASMVLYDRRRKQWAAS